MRDANHRYKMPALATKTESRGNGVKTVVVNMAAVAKALRVDPRCRFCERVLFFFRVVTRVARDPVGPWVGQLTGGIVFVCPRMHRPDQVHLPQQGRPEPLR